MNGVFVIRARRFMTRGGGFPNFGYPHVFIVNGPGDAQPLSPEGPCTQKLGTWDLGNNDFGIGFR